MRDATAATSNNANAVVSGLDVGKGALHRSSSSNRTASGGGGNSKVDTAVSNNATVKKSIKKETVRIKTNVKAATSSTSSSTSASGVGSSTSSAMHDVGWKQRLPTATTTSSAASAATSTVIKSSTTTSTAAAAAATTTTSPTVVATLGPFGTARRIIQREGPMALYKGLTAVYTGIVPKMAIRFVSFEYYRDVLGGWYNTYQTTSSSGGSVTAAAASTAAAEATSIPPQVTFFAGLLSGLTEAILVVTPAEVCKIRMQSQYHSLMDPTQMTHMKYKNVVQTAALVVKEEGLGALYKGVVPTMLRQGCNQAVNFTAYNWSKKRVLAWKKERAAADGTISSGEITLDHWQSLLLGGLSGGMGPLVNNPLDVVKTRMQKQVIRPGTEPKYQSLMQSCMVIAKEEGTLALWKGITPRLMRIMPGQAITFMTYEAVSKQMERYGMFD
jgi:solute carrier family 25 (mitochondrial citrate transporter), member 1